MKKFLPFILILIMMCSLTLAHSGRTDSKGGHYNRSTGEYHYHHGYSAHQHENGICPYSKVTNTTSSSNESDSNVSSPSITTTVKKDTDDKSIIANLFSYGITFIILSPYIVVLLEPLYTCLKNKINKK